MHIAIAEDDLDQQDLLRLWLEGAQHSVATHATVASYLDALKHERFDMLLIDWMLPDGTGADLLQWARGNLGWETPILVLTARDDEETVVQALQAGADDYVVKPPKHAELLARVAALGRRVRSNGLPVLRLGAFEIDIQRQRLSLDGEPVVLTQKEFDLSAYLFQNPGKLLSRDHLLNKIWGLNAEVDTRTVDTHVSRLRKKLGLDGSRGWKLVPVYGVGYRFERTEVPAAA
ncbi:response regulator transcription factor [Azohydromonas aeria]|uniref:response regulator transcription factor n=1 Tax=Azohydromonas aeria TaxID=2590212 RepID=UPI0012FCBB7F|nr:response regulator transcription factor [Azohydromonas aeria]